MKKFNIIYKKNNQLVLSFISYDRKIERLMLKQFAKLKNQFNIVEVTK